MLRKKWLLLGMALFVVVNLFSVSLPMAVASETLTLSVVADTFVESDKPSANNGDMMWLMVDFSNQTTSETVRRNSYLLFDLTSLSTNINSINLATLQLRRSWAFPQTAQVGVHSCSDTQWNEMEMTWSNAPSFSPEPLDITAVVTDTNAERYSWDVTETVKNAQGGNLTLVLTVEDADEGTYITGFNSKDMKYDIPELRIQYDYIPEFPTWTLLPILAAVSVAALVVRKKLCSKPEKPFT